MTWIALGVTLAAAAVGAYNTQQTARRQDRALASQIRGQAALEQKASAKIAEALAAQEQSSPADEQAKQMDSYLATLRQGQQNDGINSGPGGFSEEYRRGTEQAGQELADYGSTRAGLLSRIDAPRLQRQNEGILFNNLGNEIQMIGREASGQAYLDGLRYNSIRRDPWLDALASIGGAAGGAMAGRGGSAATNIGPVEKQPILFYG